MVAVCRSKKQLYNYAVNLMPFLYLFIYLFYCIMINLMPLFICLFLLLRVAFNALLFGH